MRSKLTFSNVLAVLALFVALGGSAVAAGVLPKGSVDTPSLAKEAVRTGKIAKGAVTPSRLSQGVFDALGDSGTGLAKAAGQEADPVEEAPQTVAAAGSLQAGLFSIGSGDRQVVSFPTPLAAKPSSYKVLPKDGSSPECPGAGADGEHPTAAPGVLCLYVRDAGGIEWTPEAQAVNFHIGEYCGGYYQTGFEPSPHENNPTGFSVPYLWIDGLGYGQVPPSIGADGKGEVAWWENLAEQTGGKVTKANYCEWRYEHRNAVPGTYSQSCGCMKEVNRPGMSRFGFDLRFSGGNNGGGSEIYGVWAVGS